MNTKVVCVYSSEEVNIFDLITDDGVVIAYYYEHFVDPSSNEVLQNPVFEIYYDYIEENEYESSLLSEDFNDIADIIDNL